MKISVIGLGYVGLPLFLELSKNFMVQGFDHDSIRVNELKRGFDKNDFARNHTGGELGKQLALKVESVMQTLNDVAQIDEND